EVRVIERIESFRAELEGHAFANPKVLEQPEVHIFETGVVDHVADPILVVEGALRRLAPLESATSANGIAAGFIERIDPPVLVGIAAVVSHGLLVIEAAVVKDPELAQSARKAAILSDTNVIGIPANVGGQSGLQLNQTADLPAAKDLSGDVLPAEEGQLVQKIRDKDVAVIELGRTPEIVGVVGVGDDVALVGTVVHGLA